MTLGGYLEPPQRNLEIMRVLLLLLAAKFVCSYLNGLFTVVSQANPAWGLAHCSLQAQARLYSTLEYFDDFVWSIGPALNGLPGAISFQSFNYPAFYLAPTFDDPEAPTRLGLVQDPNSDDASFMIVSGLDGQEGSISAASLSNDVKLRGRFVTVGGALTGACADVQNGIALDVILDDGLLPIAASWMPSSMDPPLPQNVTIIASKPANIINTNFLGCHADMGKYKFCRVCTTGNDLLIWDVTSCTLLICDYTSESLQASSTRREPFIPT